MRVVFFKRHKDDDPDEAQPGQEFLRACPGNVAAKLIAIIDAVVKAPPPQFTGGGMWEAMHGTMGGYYEARTQGPDRRLYRLFCLLEREAPGLSRPSIVVLGGLSKLRGTAFRASDYATIRQLGDEYRSHTPRSIA
jgi:hypothetical protein